MTAQVGDSLGFEGRRFSLACEPLADWLSRRKNKALRFRQRHTACSRGYVARWEVSRGRLYLASIAGTLSGGTVASLDALFVHHSKQSLDSVGANAPANAGPGAFAFWVTGTLCCALGPLLKYAHTGYESISQRELHLVMRDGFLIGTRIVQREMPRDQGTWDVDDDLMDIEAPVLWRGGTQAPAAPTIGG